MRWLSTLAVPLIAYASGAPIAHFYYMDDAGGLQSLYAHYSRMSVVSPVWLTVNDKLELRVSPDRHLLAWAARRVKLMPVLVNEQFAPQIAHGALSAPGMQEALAVAILRSAASLDLYGIQLDFENIQPEDRDAYTHFVARVCEGLARAHRVCSVAVPAPLVPDSRPAAPAPKWRENDQAKGFDYAALSRASGFVSLMAYDEYTAPSEPGPIAGYPWVEACIRKTLESVAKEKILLGVPLYHRLWTGEKVSVGPFAEAEEFARKCHSVSSLDPLQQEWTATCHLAGAPSIVWYQTADTLKKRLDLVAQYGLAGISAWRLGQEGQDVWEDVFRSFGGKRG